MPQKVGPIRRPDQTSIPPQKNPKQSGVVVITAVAPLLWLIRRV